MASSEAFLFTEENWINMEDIDKIYNLIKEHDSIVIFGHKLPDGDCYGSQVALKQIIKTNFPNKQVYALGSGIPEFFTRLGRLDDIDDYIIEKSLGIIVDVNDLNRVEDERIKLTKVRCKIDHHIDDKAFVGVSWVDVGIVAVCQMIGRFANKYKLVINKVAAEALFLGLCTDSGRFQYNPTNKETFSLAAQLIESGADINAIYATLYEVKESHVKWNEFLFSHYKKTPNGVIYVIAKHFDYTNLGLDFPYASSQVNVFSNIKDCPIWTLFTEDETGTYRGEVRSQDINIQEVCYRHGGGGHRCASGVNNIKDEKTIYAILQDLDTLLKDK